MTIQEMFDKAVEGLASQGFKRSTQPSGSGCLYNSRSEDGAVMHCAWGWIDQDISESDNGASVDQLDRDSVFYNLDQPSRAFARKLQKAHDSAYDSVRAEGNSLIIKCISNPDAMKHELRMLCDEYSLIMPEVLK